MTVPPSFPMPEPRRRRSLLPWIVGLVVVLAIVGAVGMSQGWFGGAPGASASPDASAPGVVPADGNIVAEGRAVPISWAEVLPASSGRVASLPVAEGATVAAGDALIQLDDQAASFDIDTAKAGLAAATASVASAEAGVDAARAGVDQAQAGVDQAQAARRSASASLGAARAGVRSAQAAVSAAVAARDALPKIATRAQKRQADAAIAQASAGVSQASSQAAAASASVDQAAAAVNVAQGQLGAARAQLRTAQAGVDAAKADEARARVAVSLAEYGRSQLAITSPIAGTVVAIEPAVGDLVGPTAVVARVADTSAWRFETTDLSETSIARVAPGSKATITVDGLPGVEIPGTVETVGGYGAQVAGDITFRVVVAPSGEVPAGLRWNMTVTIQIEG